jgi:hypothetical protein
VIDRQLVAGGDARESPNRACWDRRAEMQYPFPMVFAHRADDVRPAHASDVRRQHGLIAGQAEGLAVLGCFRPDAPPVTPKNAAQVYARLNQ